MADILIRGMENIPVGQEFVIVENIDFERYLYNRETGTAFHLVPLQEAHGKIIDGDALWENMTVEQSEAFQKGLAGTIDLFEMLEAAPAIVPAEGKTDNEHV